MRYTTLIAPMMALTVAACGGSNGSNTTQGTTLAYTDPSDTSSWRLVADASSTPTRLVLALVGPAGTMSRGVGFNLQLPPELKAVTFTESHMPAQDTGVYELGKALPDSTDARLPPDIVMPTAFAAGVKPGNLLTVGIFQKDRRYGAKDSGVPLVCIALELRSGAAVSVGAGLKLTVPKAKVLPEDIGTVEEGFDVMYQKSHIDPITVAVGRLVVR